MITLRFSERGKDKTYGSVTDTIGANHLFVRINSTMLRMISKDTEFSAGQLIRIEKKKIFDRQVSQDILNEKRKIIFIKITA